MRGLTDSGIGDGPAAVLLHGGVINRHMWDPVSARLADRYRLIALDLPGHGDLHDQAFRIETSVDRVSRVMNELELERATLVGLSLGGYVAQAFAARFPDRTDGLVLSGATIRYTGWDGLSTAMFGWVFPVAAIPARRAFAKQLGKLGPEIAGPILEGGLSMKGGAQALRRLTGRDYAQDMVGYTGPIVIANGERDDPNREGEEGFLEHFPSAIITVIEDAGHACALQQPEAFAAVIDGLMTEVAT